MVKKKKVNLSYFVHHKGFFTLLLIILIIISLIIYFAFYCPSKPDTELNDGVQGFVSLEIISPPSKVEANAESPSSLLEDEK